MSAAQGPACDTEAAPGVALAVVGEKRLPPRDPPTLLEIDNLMLDAGACVSQAKVKLLCFDFVESSGHRVVICYVRRRSAA